MRKARLRSARSAKAAPCQHHVSARSPNRRREQPPSKWLPPARQTLRSEASRSDASHLNRGGGGPAQLRTGLAELLPDPTPNSCVSQRLQQRGMQEPVAPTWQTPSAAKGLRSIVGVSGSDEPPPTSSTCSPGGAVSFSAPRSRDEELSRALCGCAPPCRPPPPSPLPPYPQQLGPGPRRRRAAACP